MEKQNRSSVVLDLSQNTLQAEALGNDLPALLLAAERVAEIVAQGFHARRRTGTGDAFWQYRPYRDQDSLNVIDWRRSARSDDLYVRETEWEASQSIWLWADRSPSMHYKGSDRPVTKMDRAHVLLLASASILLRGGERVGLLGHDLYASRGQNGFRHLADRLAHLGTQTVASPDCGNLPRHSQALLFSDFLDSETVWRRRFAEFAEQQVTGYAVQILDPVEETLPFRGRVRFQGLEEEGEFQAERAETLRPAYQTRLADHRNALKQAARAAGWHFMTHHTHISAEQAMLTLYAALSKREGGGC